MRLVDGQNTMSSGEVIVGRIQVAEVDGNGGCASTRGGRGQGADRGAAGDAGGVLIIDKAAEGLAERRIALPVHPRLVIGAHRQMRLVDGQHTASVCDGIAKVVGVAASSDGVGVGSNCALRGAAVNKGAGQNGRGLAIGQAREGHTVPTGVGQPAVILAVVSGVDGNSWLFAIQGIGAATQWSAIACTGLVAVVAEIATAGANFFGHAGTACHAACKECGAAVGARRKAWRPADNDVSPRYRAGRRILCGIDTDSRAGRTGARQVVLDGDIAAVGGNIDRAASGNPTDCRNSADGQVNVVVEEGKTTGARGRKRTHLMASAGGHQVVGRVEALQKQ